MKKMYLLSFLLLCIFFSTTYILSYNYTKDRLAENESTQEESVVAVDRPAGNIITNNTKLIVQNYCIEDESLLEKEENVTAAMIGLDREELIEYVDEYMNNPTLYDNSLGIVDYEVISFSDECVVLRKTYGVSPSEFRYYLVEEKGYVVVYYTDKITVYSYTDIRVSDLPEEEQESIKAGKYIETIHDLYNYLEAYTS